MVRRVRFRGSVVIGLAGLTWVALALAVAPTLAEESTTTRNPRTSPADVAAGAKTFRSHCGSCHGVNGEGGRGPNLTSGVFFHGSSDLDLLNNISDGIQGTEMPGLFYSLRPRLAGCGLPSFAERGNSSKTHSRCGTGRGAFQEQALSPMPSSQWRGWAARS